jgi:hypothetical protein
MPLEAIEEFAKIHNSEIASAAIEHGFQMVTFISESRESLENLYNDHNGYGETFPKLAEYLKTKVKKREEVNGFQAF